MNNIFHISYEVCGLDTYTVLFVDNIYTSIESTRNSTDAWEIAWILYDKATNPVSVSERNPSYLSTPIL